MTFTRLLTRTLVSLAATAAFTSVFAQDSRLVARTVAPGQGPSLAQRYGLRLLGTSLDGRRVLLDARSTTMGSIYKYMLSSDPAVDTVDTNTVLSLGSQSGKGSTIPVISVDPAVTTSNPEMLTQVNAAGTGTGARTVKLAVLDTGLSTSSPLWSSVIASSNTLVPSAGANDIATNSDSDGDGKKDESVGHGTLVATLAKTIAPNAKLIVVKVADADGAATIWSMQNGVDFAIAQGAEVVNISLGTGYDNAILNNVINYTEAAGVTLVAAIGNNEMGYALFPSLNTKVIAVAGVNLDDTKDPNSNWSLKTEVSAPASGSAMTTSGTLGEWSGTSFSSALVAGAIADGLANTTPKTPSAVRDALLSSGTNIDSLNPEYAGQLGSRLNVAALRVALMGS